MPKHAKKYVDIVLTADVSDYVLARARQAAEEINLTPDEMTPVLASRLWDAIEHLPFPDGSLPDFGLTISSPAQLMILAHLQERIKQDA